MYKTANGGPERISIILSSWISKGKVFPSAGLGGP
jgi:hypothetical protein